MTQRAFVVSRAHKPAALGRILDVEAPTAAIVFCRTRTEVDQLTETLNGRGYRAEALHGGMTQEGRDRVMGRLRNGTAELLVATDVAARGLDVDQLTHVINYDVPSAPDAYVHRIGRVGRAGREGVAITLAEPRELRLLGNIERVTGRPIAIEKVPSVADLRARQMEATTAAVRSALEAEDLDRFDTVVDALVADGEVDVRDVARAAIKLVHEARSSEVDEIEIPEFVPRSDKRQGQAGRPARPAPGVGPARRALPGRGQDPAVHRPGQERPHPPRGPRRGHRQRVRPDRPRHRPDQHHRQVLDRRRPRRRRRRRDRGDQADHDPRQAPDHPPRPPPATLTNRY